MCMGHTPSSGGAMLQLYSSTRAEITRYRDRELLNQTVFTGAMVALIAESRRAVIGASLRTPASSRLCALSYLSGGLGPLRVLRHA